MSTKRLIITSCTSKKDNKPGPAGTFYKGLGHQYVLNGVQSIRKALGQEAVDLKIISAKYGLLDENHIVYPYDMTFQGMSKDQIIEHSRKLDIHNEVQDLVPNYGLVIYCLGKEYVEALELPFMGDGCTSHLFLLGQSHKNLLKFDDPNNIHTNYHLVPVGTDLAKQFGVMSINLKGFIIKKLGEHVKLAADNANNFKDILLNTISAEPDTLNQFITMLLLDHLDKQNEQTVLF